MTDELETKQTKDSASSWQRYAIIVAAVMVLVIVGIILIGVLLALGSQGTIEQFASWVQVIRDMFIIFLALQGVFIIIALTVLILQVARLINLLQNEVQPILKNTQETVKTATGTVQFVSENVTSPLVKISGFLAGTGVFLNNLGGLRKALRHVDPPVSADKRANSGT
jgi:cytochrome b561